MLRDDILRRRDGLRLYGLTPPKRRQDPDKVRDIAERQARRIAALAPDGLVLYDLQDEAGRTDAARPFPFLPTLEPLDYSRAYLAALDVPRVSTSAWATKRRSSSSRGSTRSRPAGAAMPACSSARRRAPPPKARARSAC